MPKASCGASEKLTAQVLDFDADGSDEVWVHSAYFSAVVAPARGGAVVEYTIFEDGVNYADVLTRRREAYHDAALAEAARLAAEAKAHGNAQVIRGSARARAASPASTISSTR